MALTHTPEAQLGTPAPAFRLPDPDGRVWSLQDCAGPRGLLVMFICNHCPYVQAIAARLARDTRELAERGVNSVAIMPNDTEAYPEDGPEYMRRFAREQGFAFPYLFDQAQQVAKAYGAVCTPDFFGYDADLKLRYRGRLDASGARKDAPQTRRDLFLAMQQVAETGAGPAEQLPSMGCSIKWRSA